MKAETGHQGQAGYTQSEIPSAFFSEAPSASNSSPLNAELTFLDAPLFQQQ